jgi:SSS family solute:Na+ symporter
MAFTGVFLGMCARVMFPQAESEMAMPMLIKEVLPVGVTGIVIAAYFSAIMSTADSCLMASSGNFVNDILHRYCFRNASEKAIMRLSQGVTLLIGIAAVVIAAGFEKVLDLIFDAYAFMVAGLFVPTLGAYFWKKSSSTGAFAAMLAGGFFTLGLLRNWIGLPESVKQVDLHPSAYGIAVSFVVFVIGSHVFPDRNNNFQTGDVNV